MIWYCDTETVQLTTENIYKIKQSMFSQHIEKRLELSEKFVNDTYKKVEQNKKKNKKNRENSDFKELPEKFTLIVVPIFLSAISENGIEITANDPITFFKKIAYFTKKHFEKTVTIYFHNLKFDLSNILDYLITYDVNFKKINSIIVGTKWYSMTILAFGIMIRFLDSFNLVHMRLSEFGKAFNLDKKLWKTEYKFDFSDIDNINKMLQCDQTLESYGLQDVRTLRAGVESFKKFVRTDKITIASTAFADWELTAKRLPELSIKEQLDANLTYCGAICTYNDEVKGKILEKECVYIDNNGLYSASSYSKSAGFLHPFPVSRGTYGEGEPDFWNIYKYYTIRCAIIAEVKSDTTIPFLRLGKHSLYGEPLKRTKPYKQNEYLKYIDETMYINSIDLRLVYKYYNVVDIKFDYYWEYETEIGIFDEYIDFWSQKKKEGKKTKNEPLRQVAKLMLNSLTGKFGQNIDPVETEIGFDEDKKILTQDNIRMKTEPKMIFMPIISAILAYSREIFLDMTNSYPKEHFFYGDTDSNLLTREAFDKYVDKTKLSDTELGLWDIEYKIKKLKILRQKTYMFTTEDNEIIIKCAGATPDVKKFITYENFEIGKRIDGATMLKPSIVAGGTALIEQPFVLRQMR